MTLKKYKCTVSFQKCSKSPDFEVTLNASSKELAKEGAKQWARQCGYAGAVKKVIAKDIQK
jgi:hypothetical protein